MAKPHVIAALACMLGAISLRADISDFQTFTTRQSYSGVLLQQGRVDLDADFNEETEGAIHQGQAFRIFSFEFDPAAVQPVVGAGIVSGLAVGAGPNGTLGGDQGLSLVVTPGLAITAFGAEIAYGAFDGEANSDVFRLVVNCPNPPCAFCGTAALSPLGGTFFLGVIAAPGSAFNRVTLEAITSNDGFVPDWQIDGIAFSPVPEPSTGALVAAILCGVAVLQRRDARMLLGNQDGCVTNRGSSRQSTEGRL
ncbi:MAG: hypothetical protein HYX25_02560 [Candidatus Solibacter usitatus]|nr:hypothetical protein [Candidatus Solibacter usitatus]